MNVYTDDQVTRNVRYILVSKSLTYTLNALSNWLKMFIFKEKHFHIYLVHWKHGEQQYIKR